MIMLEILSAFMWVDILYFMCDQKAQDVDKLKRAFTGVVGHASLELRYTSDMRGSCNERFWSTGRIPVNSCMNRSCLRRRILVVHSVCVYAPRRLKPNPTQLLSEFVAHSSHSLLAGLQGAVSPIV